MCVSTPSRSVPWKTVLANNEQKIGRALAGGHLPSLANSIVSHNELRELVFLHFLDEVNSRSISTVVNAEVVNP